jgi:hypothetical protein
MNSRSVTAFALISMVSVTGVKSDGPQRHRVPTRGNRGDPEFAEIVARDDAIDLRQSNLDAADHVARGVARDRARE